MRERGGVVGVFSVGHYLNCFSLHKRVTRVIIAPVKVTYNATSNRLGKPIRTIIISVTLSFPPPQRWPHNDEIEAVKSRVI